MTELLRFQQILLNNNGLNVKEYFVICDVALIYQP